MKNFEFGQMSFASWKSKISSFRQIPGCHCVSDPRNGICWDIRLRRPKNLLFFWWPFIIFLIAAKFRKKSKLIFLKNWKFREDFLSEEIEFSAPKPINQSIGHEGFAVKWRLRIRRPLMFSRLIERESVLCLFAGAESWTQCTAGELRSLAEATTCQLRREALLVGFNAFYDSSFGLSVSSLSARQSGSISETSEERCAFWTVTAVDWFRRSPAVTFSLSSLRSPIGKTLLLRGTEDFFLSIPPKSPAPRFADTRALTGQEILSILSI
jgi:hypothetical protein